MTLCSWRIVALQLTLLFAVSPASAQPTPATPPVSEQAAAAPEHSALEPAPKRFTWLPGDAREISHASSASRDTAVLEGILYPRISVTFGTEFGFFRWRARGVSWRPGLFALFNLESRTRAKHFFPAPGGDSDLWRGTLGYQLSCAFDRFAERYFGERGALELTLGYFHESEHHSARNGRLTEGEGPDHPELRGLPQMNNFLISDLAGRTTYRKLEFVARLQGRLFVNGPATQREPFTWALGGDVIVRARHLDWVQPFSATFAEVIKSPVMRDANTIRTLLGAAFPGAYGELSIYLSLTSGAGKGLLIPKHETDFGGGLRYSPFRI